MIEIFVCLLVIGIVRLLQVPGNMVSRSRNEKRRRKLMRQEQQRVHSEQGSERKRRFERLLNDYNYYTAEVAKTKEDIKHSTDESMRSYAQRYLNELYDQMGTIRDELSDEYHIELE